MKEYETLKVYGKTLRKWTHEVTVEWKGEKRQIERPVQYEIAYTEYDATGRKVGVGSEDFSFERYNNLKTYRVFAWDGEKRNKGGYRWFDVVQTATVEKKNRKKLAELAAVRFPTAAVIDVR